MSENTCTRYLEIGSVEIEKDPNFTEIVQISMKDECERDHTILIVTLNDFKVLKKAMNEYCHGSSLKTRVENPVYSLIKIQEDESSGNEVKKE